MNEQLIMYLICALVWFFILSPALAGYISNSSSNTYMELVWFGAALTAMIFGFVCLCVLGGLAMAFISGDSTPITTLINNINGI